MGIFYQLTVKLFCSYDINMRLPVSSKTWFLLLLIFISTSLFLFHAKSNSKIYSVSPNIVISEIQIAGENANDEFIELYNPTTQDVTMTNWRLSKRTSTLTGTITNLVSSLSGTISAHGYFLVANPQFTSTVVPDLWYSASTSGIAVNNTVILYSDAGQTVVDKVGLGTAEDNEAQSTVVPPPFSSIERKASSSSSSESMGMGGIDELQGNGFDTDNNNNDFVLRSLSQPQNNTQIEPLILPTLTPTNTPAPTLLPTIIPTSTPALISPTSTPANTPSPTSTPTPDPTPLPTLTPSITPAPTITLSPTPTPITPRPGVLRFSLQCKPINKSINSPLGVLSLPIISCKLVRL